MSSPAQPGGRQHGQLTKGVGENQPIFNRINKLIFKKPHWSTPLTYVRVWKRDQKSNPVGTRILPGVPRLIAGPDQSEKALRRLSARL
jgi:hypothetical protein